METQLPEAYALLLARIRAMEQELATLREELADLCVQVSEARYEK